MSLSLAGKFARRELRGGLRGFRIFLACLALGVAAISAVGTVRSSIEAGLAREGAALLGGDAEMEFTYRFATSDERGWMEDTALRVSEIIDFRSMALVRRDAMEERALTQVKAVDKHYPLVGSVSLKPDIPLAEALAGKDGLPGAVIDPVLRDRMGLDLGSTFWLGTQEFVLTATLEREPDNASAGFGLGPRSIVATQSLAGSGLLEPGTLFTTKYRLDLLDTVALAEIQEAAMSHFESTGLRWRDARDGAPGVAEFVRRLGAFLVLVGLSGLAVGGVGVSAAVRAYLSGKTGTIATLRTLGADRRTIFLTYLLQVGALSLAGILIGVLAGGGVPVLLAPLIEANLPVPAVFGLYPTPLIEASIYGLLTALIFTLWPLARTEEIRAATLFRDALDGGRILPPARYLAATFLLLALLIGVAVWFSGSARLTLWTAGGVLGALILLTCAGLAIRAVSRMLRPVSRGRPPMRWALASIAGQRGDTLSVVLSLGLGLSVLAAVGQIDGNLRNAISKELPDVAPSYFFVDIQKEQMPGFMARTTGDPAVSRVETSPMLRGVITRINGKPAREVAGEHWVVQGDRGITYYDAKPENTTITEGDWWPEGYSGPPLISFAAEEATEMGIGLGDTMTVNILGRDITATIASLRDVDFSTAGMGFVMALNAQALSGAPHSFIATVYAEQQAEAGILRNLANQFPNITAIRVRDALTRVADLLAGLATATSYGAAATLLTGFLVLIGAAAAGEQARTYEAAILKTLGATRRRIMTSFVLRAAFVGLAAGTVAICAGIIGGWAVCYFVMETGYLIVWPSALAIVFGGIVATVLAGLGFAWRPLAARPAQVLRARE